jgi:enamine deaminase RidA (YjgF/YER057c/UK114 family)
MKLLNRRTALGAAFAVATAGANSATAQASPASDKAVGITRSPATSKIASLAVRHGNVLYMSGVEASDLTADFVGQTKQIFARIDMALATFGTSKENVLAVTILAKSIANKPAFNEAWIAWLGGTGLPARVFSVVADLDPGCLVEIQVTAACVPV